MSQERDAQLARQLLAQLDGQPLPDTDEQVQALTAFAQGLAWPAARPEAAFQARLRRKLIEPTAAARPRRSHFPLWSFAGVAAMIVVVVFGVLVAVGPRISTIFGTVYNYLDGPSEEYNRPYVTPVKQTVIVIGPTQDVRVTAAPTAPPAASPAGEVYPAPARMIIKDAQLQILVEDTDVALDRLTGIAAQYGGYILSCQTWYDGIYKQATVVIQVPSDYFEQALSRVRQVALQVERESASGQDVTDQYVDLEAQLLNLEATAARLRAFLEKAATVEEALKINTELSRIEGQIARIKGQMSYLAARSAYSTITIDLHPPRPASTPTPTPMPVVWQPGQTAERAMRTVTSIGRFLVEALIWIGIVVVPVVGLPTLIVWAIAWATRRARKRPPRETGLNDKF